MAFFSNLSSKYDRFRSAFRSEGDSSGDIFSAAYSEGMRDAAYQTTERPKSESQLLSSDGSVENMERIELMREARPLFENVAAVKGAEKVHARFCSPIMWYAQTGDDDVDRMLTDYVSKQMEAENFDLAQCHDLPTCINSAIIDWGIDGDIFSNFVTPSGSRKFRTQWIRAHRVGDSDRAFDVSDEFTDFFGLSERKKFKEVGGIVMDDIGRRQAIKVYKENRNIEYITSAGKKSAQSIPYSQICHLYNPLKTDRTREVTRWNGVIPEIIDLKQIWRYLKATIKMQVSAPIVQTNAKGKAPRVRSKPSLDSSSSDSTTVERPDLREILPGQIQYLKPGETLVDFSSQRPNATFFEAVEHLMKQGAWAIDMPYPFVFDSKGLNGGSLRLENNKAGAMIKSSRDIVVKCFLDKWVKAKILEGIRNGMLPGLRVAHLSKLSKGRWAWPELPTADEKYSNQITISMCEAGLMSGQDIVGPKGTTIEAVQDQKEKEARRIAMKAIAANKEFPDFPIEWWVDRMAKVGPNGSTTYRFPSDLEEDLINKGIDPKTVNAKLANIEMDVAKNAESAKKSEDKLEAVSETLAIDLI